MSTCDTMGWLRLVGSLKLQVSFAKEPNNRDGILQKRPIILRSLLIVAIPHPYTHNATPHPYTHNAIPHLYTHNATHPSMFRAASVHMPKGGAGAHGVQGLTYQADPRTVGYTHPDQGLYNPYLAICQQHPPPPANPLLQGVPGPMYSSDPRSKVDTPCTPSTFPCNITDSRARTILCTAMQ